MIRQRKAERSVLLRLRVPEVRSILFQALLSSPYLAAGMRFRFPRFFVQPSLCGGGEAPQILPRPDRSAFVAPLSGNGGQTLPGRAAPLLCTFSVSSTRCRINNRFRVFSPSFGNKTFKTRIAVSVSDNFARKPLPTLVFRRFVLREDVFSSEKVTARIKKRYDACGMTPHAIAELSDGELAESTIYRILNGTSRDPSFRSLVVMMRTMGGNVCELLEDEAPEEAVPPKVDETAERLIAIYERIISEQKGGCAR